MLLKLLLKLPFQITPYFAIKVIGTNDRDGAYFQTRTAIITFKVYCRFDIGYFFWYSYLVLMSLIIIQLHRLSVGNFSPLKWSGFIERNLAFR